MDTYKETSASWNKVAKLYEKSFMNVSLYDESYSYYYNLIPKGGNEILEIGCGPGNITKYLLKHNPRLQITGLDIAPNMVTLAKKNNPTANFRVMDCRSINTIKSKFNGIVCGFCIPYLIEKDTYKLLKDCNNLLIQGGILYLSFVEGDSYSSIYMKGSTGNGMYFQYYNLNSLIVILKQNSFEINNVFHEKYTNKDKKTEIHTILIAKKIELVYNS